MSQVYIPEGYRSPLSVYEMQRAIEFIKNSFQVNLGSALNLRRVSAPLFVAADSGLNDDLNGYERPVSFDIAAVDVDPLPGEMEAAGVEAIRVQARQGSVHGHERHPPGRAAG